MRTRSTLLRAIACWLAVLAVACAFIQPAGGVTPARGGRRHTVTLGVGSNFEWRVNIADERHDVPKLARLGIHYLREGIFWDVVQPDSSHEWEWSLYDGMFRRAAERGMRVLPVLAFGTAWASPAGNTYAVPDRRRSRAAYASFAAAVVRRYGPHGIFWRRNPGRDDPISAVEVWNEPWFLGDTTPRNYAELLHVAGRAVHAVSDRVTVLANVDDRNVEDRDGSWHPWGALVLRHRGLLAGAVDGWALHPYPSTARYLHQTALYNSLEQVAWLRTVLRRRHYAGAVWVTEIGFSDAANGVQLVASPRSARCNYSGFVRAVQRMRGRNPVTHVFAFTAARPTTSTKKGSWDYGYNLFNRRGTPAAALLSFASA